MKGLSRTGPSFPLAFSESLAPHLPISVPLVESVDVVRVPSGLRVRDSSRASRTRTEAKEWYARWEEKRILAFSQELSGCARNGENSIPRGGEAWSGKRERSFFPRKYILSLREMTRSYRLMSRDGTSRRRLNVLKENTRYAICVLGMRVGEREMRTTVSLTFVTKNTSVGILCSSKNILESTTKNLANI